MAQRLRRVARDELTITRLKCGKGFRFCDAEGVTIRDKAIKARVTALGIPPAWTDVVIATDDRAHIQALGVDAAGRVQYIYHPDWEIRRTRRKHARLGEIAQILSRVRHRVARDLEAEAGTCDLALAIAVALIDRTAMRIGRERYLKSSGTRGASTLLKRDVRIVGETLRLRFPAKGGKLASYTLKDAALCAAIRRVRTLPGARLLQCRQDSGQVRPIRAEMINAYLQSIADSEITAKDFRMLHATAMAGDELARIEPGRSPTARRRQVAQVVKQVADALQNTPAISRKSYIAPRIIELFENGRLKRVWDTTATGRGRLKAREVRLSQVVVGPPD